MSITALEDALREDSKGIALAQLLTQYHRWMRLLDHPLPLGRNYSFEQRQEMEKKRHLLMHTFRTAETVLKRLHCRFHNNIEAALPLDDSQPPPR